MKTCTRCGLTKPVNNFSNNRNQKDGLCSWCKTCSKTYIGEWYKKNAEKIKRASRKWYRTNRERAYRATQRWGQANMEKVKEIKKRWRVNNPQYCWAQGTLSKHKRELECKIQISIRDLTEIAIKTGHCWICGRKLNWSSGNKGGGPGIDSPSLDRINGEKIINLNTIHIICHNCNARKGQMSLREFLATRRRKAEAATTSSHLIQ